MNGHIVSPKVYVGVFAILISLTVLTTVAAYIDLGIFNTPIAVSIAVGKMLLVVLFFMHVRYSSQMVKVVAGTGVMWLIILFALTLSDYLTRGWVPNAPGW